MSREVAASRQHSIAERQEQDGFRTLLIREGAIREDLHAVPVCIGQGRDRRTQ